VFRFDMNDDEDGQLMALAGLFIFLICSYVFELSVMQIWWLSKESPFWIVKDDIVW
jgi:hypothetical protein